MDDVEQTAEVIAENAVAAGANGSFSRRDSLGGDPEAAPILAATPRCPPEDGTGKDEQVAQAAPPPQKVIVMLCFLYFLGGISSSTFGRFSAVYYISRGLDAFQIGLLEGVMPIMRSFIAPCWGFVADVTKKKKIVSQTNRLIALIFLCCLGVHELSDAFWKIFVIAALTTLFCGSGSILDAYALEVCGASARKLYGRIRLWMAISWGVGTLLMGIIANADHDDWKWNFVMYGAFGITNITVTVLFIPDKSPVEKRLGEESAARRAAAAATSTSVNGSDSDAVAVSKQEEALVEAERKKVLWNYLTSVYFITLLLQSIMFWAAMGIVERLMFVYLVNDLGGNTVLCGLCVFVNVLLEIPVFWFAEAIQVKLGQKMMFSISLVTYVIRVLGYTFLDPSTKWLILLLEALHGVTFAIMWLYVINRSNDTTPSGWSGTVQGLVGNAASCLGTGGGSIIGGWIMNAYGAKALYRWAAVIVSAVVVLHWIVWMVLWIRRRQQSKN